MPVKWTPDNDQLLLLKILETHELSVDAKKISAAWPTDGEVPTARAITERLVKIRSLSRANGAGNFAISSAQSKNTPRKPGTPRKSGASTAAPTRKLKTSTSNNDTTDFIDDDTEPERVSPSKRKRGPSTDVKVETIEIDDDTPDLDRYEVISRRPLLSTAHPDTPDRSTGTAPAGDTANLSMTRLSLEQGESPSKRPRRGSVKREYAESDDEGAMSHSGGSDFASDHYEDEDNDAV